MKKFTMLSSVLASALMLTVASCSSEDVAGGDSQNDKGGGNYFFPCREFKDCWQCSNR